MRTVALLLTADEFYCVGCAMPHTAGSLPLDAGASPGWRVCCANRALAIWHAVMDIGFGLLPGAMRSRNSAPFAMTEAEADTVIERIGSVCSGSDEEIDEEFGGLRGHISEIRTALEMLLERLRRAREHQVKGTHVARLPVPIKVCNLSIDEVSCILDAKGYYAGPPFYVATRRSFTPAEELADDNVSLRLAALRRVPGKVPPSAGPPDEESRFPFAMTELELAVLNEQLAAVIKEAADDEDELAIPMHAFRTPGRPADGRSIVAHLAELLERMKGEHAP